LIILGLTCNKDGVDTNTCTIIRVDYRTNKHERIGEVVEHRKEERKNNVADMLRLARKIYVTSSSGEPRARDGPRDGLTPSAPPAG